MNQLEEPVADQKLYYSIGEVAGMLGVATSLIRFWETEFAHIKPKKNVKGDRRYTAKNIEDLKVVYNLVKEKGFTLQGAKEFLKGKKDKKNSEVIDTLNRVKRLLLEIRDRLPEA